MQRAPGRCAALATALLTCPLPPALRLQVILYSFYKNVALVMALFLYNMDNGVSGSTYFESIVKVGWNFFLALPIIAYGVWDRDVDDADLRTDAALYRPGPRNAHLNAVQFVKWVLSACLHAACTYFFVRACSLAAWGSGGQEEGWAVAGLTGYTCLLLLVNYKVVLLFKYAAPPPPLPLPPHACDSPPPSALAAPGPGCTTWHSGEAWSSTSSSSLPTPP